MLLMTYSKYFPDESMMMIRDKFETMDESKTSMLYTLGLKDPTMALILSIVAGGLGIDRFYIGDTGLGIAKLLTCGGCGIWTIIDYFLIMKVTKEKNLEKYKKKQKLERDRAVERAVDLIAHPKKYDKVSAKGASGYVMNLSFTQDGEIVNKNLVLDTEKIAEEEKYDGYYSIVTSELKMDDIEIREKYRGLIRIEDTFKITKSEFDTRPIYVRTNGHIDGHFTTCFTALVLIRLLQVKLENRYTVGKLLTSLKKCNCAHIDSNYHQFFYYDEILENINNGSRTIFSTAPIRTENIPILPKP